MEKGASRPFAQAKRTDFQVLRKGAARPFSIGRISPPRAPRKKSEEFKNNSSLANFSSLAVQILPPNPSPVVLSIENLG
jgi:hypothetical protein